ncbi:head completion/stabilization protein [Pseudomonas sp. BN415]|uniref:head completion/stabilization protein n=1 Tax=Pseudomonas sp. BN415 TaxID=2567889 RepID=UPI002458C17C|nr:head completion/stabilization protein [Pseudomonas sp. BN415]MDH4585646.1 head completion/stabilization protein [Pseudomonas sp. BN415]
MSGFVASGTVVPVTLTNDGFWPDIEGEAVRAAMRLEPGITPERLTEAVVAAMVNVNRELRSYKLARQAEGQTKLADVPADEINGESELVIIYRRAIYCSAGAEVAERFPNTDTSRHGAMHAEQLAPTVDDLRRDARFAIRDLLAVSRTTVELL